MVNDFELKKKKRQIFIDVLRGIAVLWMIETHVVDVCLWRDFKHGFFYDMLNISNGFVAVTFLFCAGAGFWLAAEKKVQDYKHFKAPLWVYLRRLGLILILAYYMHLPVFSFSKLFAMTPVQMNIFFQNDVLQTIVYSSIIALIFLMLSPKNIIFKYLSIALALFFILPAPYMYYIDPFEKLPYFFAFLVSFPPISKFPLFPWAGYFFAGIAMTAFFMDSKNRDKFAKTALITSIVLLFLIYNLRDSIAFINMDQWWKISPFHTLFRLCGSIFAFTSLYLLEKYYTDKKYINFLVISGRESLYLYMSHLMIVYGSVANFGVKYLGLNGCNPFETLLMILGIGGLCYTTAAGWHSIKLNYPKRAQMIMLSLGIMITLIFLLNRY
jgi:uncharacterized membrane protein